MPTQPLIDSNICKVKLTATDLPTCRWFEICWFCFRPEEGFVGQKACLVLFVFVFVCVCVFVFLSFLNLIKIWSHLQTNKQPKP